jgi:hypothetical protein
LVLPEQPVRLDETKIAAASEMTRQCGLAARRIADDDDPDAAKSGAIARRRRA